MNTKLIATAIACSALFSSASFAASVPASGEFSSEPSVSAPSTLTRASVMAEVVLAAKNGTLVLGGETERSPQLVSAVPARSRAAVKTEMRLLAHAPARGEFSM